MYLWTLEDIEHLSSHPKTRIREWAVDRLITAFRDQAGPLLAARLVEEDRDLLKTIVEALISRKDAKKYEDILLDRVKEAEGDRFGVLVSGLAAMDSLQAKEIISERMERARKGELFHDMELRYTLKAMTYIGSDALGWLMEMIESSDDNEVYMPNFLLAVLLVKPLNEVAELLELGRGRSVRMLVTVLEATASAVGYRNLFDTFTELYPGSHEEIIEFLEDDYPVSDKCHTAIANANIDKYSDTFRILLAEAQDILESRHIDIKKLAAEKQIFGDFNTASGEIVLGMTFLQYMADKPAPEVGQRRLEFCLAVIALGSMKWAADEYQADPSMLNPKDYLEMLLSDRPRDLKELTEAVAARGPSVLPALIERLQSEHEEFSWGAFRAARAINLLADSFPRDCEQAIPVLIAAINKEMDDLDLMETCHDALARIGPVVIEYIRPHIGGEDSTRDAYLSSVLGHYPTESALRAIIDQMKGRSYLEDWHIIALTNIGSAEAIDFILERADPEDEDVAESLIMLCEINDITRPEMKKWECVLRETDAIIKELTIREVEKMIATPPQPPQPRQPSTTPKKKGISKAEKKKRAKIRMQGRKKKK